MLDTVDIRENYSGIVKLRLRLEGNDFRLSRLGPGYVVFRDPVELNPGHAEVVMTIDDREHRWPVHLPDGANGSMSRVRATQV